MRLAIVRWKYFVVWIFLGRQFFQQFFYGRESLCIAKEQLPTDIHFIWRRVSASLRIKISWNRIKDYRTFNNYVLLGDNALSPNECQGMSKKKKKVTYQKRSFFNPTFLSSSVKPSSSSFLIFIHNCMPYTSFNSFDSLLFLCETQWAISRKQKNTYLNFSHTQYYYKSWG